MTERLDSGELLYDHEILEILLYNACPRVNTNPIAHALLERFCSLSEVLKADVKELTSVAGVGENVANYLRVAGLCAERIGSIEGAAVLKTYGDCKQFVSFRLRGKSEEFLEIYFLDKSGKVKRIYSYTSANANMAEARAEEIVRNIALAKPHGILAAHNHLNGSTSPSVNDENFTKQLQLICNLNSVTLWDHLIYSDGGFYSFRDDGNLDELSRELSIKNVFKWIKTSQ